MKQLCEELLQDWCRALLQLQVKGTGNSRLDGGILCPSCGRIHGRCFETMFPFLYMASVTHEDIWLEASEQLFLWAEQTVSQPDGSYLNDIDSDWKGTTVFGTSQLADCLLFYGGILPELTRGRWRNRLHRAADFLSACDTLADNNINYPIANALALYKCGMVLEKQQWVKKAEYFARYAKQAVTPGGFLYGEGIPRDRRSPRNCYPVDIGYNVEESLPALAQYGMMSGDEHCREIARQSLAAHLDFLLDDGGWDNSFGTRNYKWTYWGSRTSDGCALGYLLYSDNHPEFAVAARKNVAMMKACTANGLLYGGPHYRQAGQPACVHHTFTHARVLAEILERKLWQNAEEQPLLPKQQSGIFTYPELGVWRMVQGLLTATVTAGDWEYLPGGHVSGGTLSLLQHRSSGTLLCAGMCAYTLKEPANMQIPNRVIHECLALRAELYVDGILYSSIYDTEAIVCADGRKIIVSGVCKDIEHRPMPGQSRLYSFVYELEDDALKVHACLAAGILVCPLVSSEEETVQTHLGDKCLRIDKKSSVIEFDSSVPFCLPYETKRIFNLVPGFQALRVDLKPEHESLDFVIKVLKS